MSETTQYLIAVTIRSTTYPSARERAVYRVPVHAQLRDVVETAKARCEIVGDLTCVGLELLGELPEHLLVAHRALFDPADVTDSGPYPAAPTGNSYVACFGPEDYAVVFHGQICTPRWKQPGPANAYLHALVRGRRTPEYGRG